jgi:hypothetical protein
MRTPTGRTAFHRLPFRHYPSVTPSSIAWSDAGSHPIAVDMVETGIESQVETLIQETQGLLDARQRNRVG